MIFMVVGRTRFCFLPINGQSPSHSRSRTSVSNPIGHAPVALLACLHQEREVRCDVNIGNARHQIASAARPLKDEKRRRKRFNPGCFPLPCSRSPAPMAFLMASMWMPRAYYQAVAIAVAQFRGDDVSPSTPRPDDLVHRFGLPGSHGGQDPLRPSREMGRA